jgi:hypothetical protein
MTNIYYCYIYLDTTKPGNYQFDDLSFNYAPFYVGKGKARRYQVHLQYVKRRLNENKNFKSHFLNTIKKILLEGFEPEILIFKGGLGEEEAYAVETKTIETIGLDNLTNIFPGGKGGRHNKNFFGRHHTDKAKEKLRISHIGNKNPMYGENYFRSEEGKISFSEKMSKENHPFFNTNRPINTRQKISKKLAGYKWPEKEKEKRSIGMKKVWQERKKEGIKINSRGSSKKLKAINLSNSSEMIFDSQKKCSEYFSLDFRTIVKKIKNKKQLNNWIISWI